jgi:16S rRNA U1498 N3-methylase RsmE
VRKQIKTLKSVLKPNENITILIGPEGDFSEKKSQWQLIVATFRLLGNTD